METNEIATIGYTAGMLGFAVLSALFLGRWKGGPYSRALSLASAASAIWGCVLTLQSLGYLSMGAFVVLTEWARSGLWIAALFMVLRTLDSRRTAEGIAKRFGLPAIIVALVLLVMYSSSHLGSLALSLIVSGGIVMALVLIGLLEQIYRNLPSDSTSSLKYVCVALLVVSAYDIVFFVRAITGGTIEADPWAARAATSMLCSLCHWRCPANGLR